MLKNSKIKISSNRSFGLVFFGFFLIVSFWPLLHENEIRIWSLIISLIFLILGILNSKHLTPLNKVWTKFGLLLGKIVSPIVMGIIFFIVITPIGFIMKLFGQDLLNKKYSQNSSYWINRKDKFGSMKKQF